MKTNKQDIEAKKRAREMRFKMNIEGNTESVLKEEDAKYVKKRI